MSATIYHTKQQRQTMKYRMKKAICTLVFVLGQITAISSLSNGANTPTQDAANQPVFTPKQATFLRSAIFENDYAAAERYIATGIDINEKYVDGSTMLHTAAMLGADKAVAAFLANGANVDAGKQQYEFSPLQIATIVKADKVMALLLSYGADVEATVDGFTTLFFALLPDTMANEMLDDFFKVLRANHVYINRDKIADRFSSAERTIALLLAHGADVNAKTEYDATPLHLAAGLNNTKIVSLLISYGADVNAQGDDGTTPLMVAVEENAWQAEKILRANGAK